MALSHWKIDAARSRLTFTVRHLVVTRVHGTFHRWAGEAEIAEAGMLDAFIVYELGTRIWAHAVLMAPDSFREDVSRLVRGFLLTPIPMGDTTAAASP